MLVQEKLVYSIVASVQPCRLLWPLALLSHPLSFPAFRLTWPLSVLYAYGLLSLGCCFVPSKSDFSQKL